MQKNAKNEPKRTKNGKISKQNVSVFMARKYLDKLIQWAETAKNGLKCFKMHSNTYSPKWAQQMVKNGKKFQKMTNNRKMSEITKYGEKITKNDKNA